MKKERFYIWAPYAWLKDGTLKRDVYALWSTTCDHAARQEYGFGMIITVLRAGKHMRIVPVQVQEGVISC